MFDRQQERELEDLFEQRPQVLKDGAFFFGLREARLTAGKLFAEVISRMDEPRKSVRSRGWG
jgi:hypothetical protein